MSEPLYPYQEEGAKWLATRKFGLLADEMRLGKTPQAIRAADLLDLKPILVLCPAVARTNWSREFARFSKRAPSIGVCLSAHQIPSALGADITICSYDLAGRIGALSNQRSKRFWLLILDEAHYLKSPSAARTKSVLSTSGLIHQADRIWALTGTPAPNHAGELWTLLRVFGAYRGSYDAFIREFCTGFNGPYGFQITGNKNVEKLRGILKPIMLRRTKKQVRPDLPDARYSEVVVEPGELTIAEIEVAFSSYIADPRRFDGLKQDLAKQQERVDAAGLAAKSSDEMLQTLASLVPHTTTLRRHIGLLKVKPVAELLREELDSGLEKVVVFAIHRDVLENLRQALAPYGAVVLNGGTAPAKRDARLNRFQTNPKCRVFIGNIAACGVAIDLSAAHDVIFLESDWVPMNNAQAAARVDGPNQHESISVRFVALAGSIDEAIQRTLRRKTSELAKIFDA